MVEGVDHGLLAMLKWNILGQRQCILEYQRPEGTEATVLMPGLARKAADLIRSRRAFLSQFCYFRCC